MNFSTVCEITCRFDYDTAIFSAHDCLVLEILANFDKDKLETEKMEIKNLEN